MYQGVFKLIQNKGWEVSSQVSVLDEEQLAVKTYLDEYPNFRIAFELVYRDSILSIERPEYEEYSARLFKYFTVKQLNYEKSDQGISIQSFENIPDDFAVLNPETGEILKAGQRLNNTKMTTNGQNYYEFQITTDQMYLQGSDSMITKGTNVYTSYALALDNLLVFKEAF